MKHVKRIFVIIALLSNLASLDANAQCGGATEKSADATSIGIVIHSNDIETVWNVFRLANYAINEGDTVTIFLLAKGVELDNLVKENADLNEQVESFLTNGGTVLGCGTCLAQRNNNEPQVCKYSSMADLYEIVKRNKIVLTF
jgi:uncharacterized protein involved in oxidation of intracellular sulfur